MSGTWIDIGGGMIHGVAQDFAEDPSRKLILAHTARRLTAEERAIGAGAPFGTVDVLIEGVSDCLREQAFTYLRSYFPDAPLHRLRHLMNSRILVFNPEVLLYKEGHPLDAVYLILTGLAELLSAAASGSGLVSAGSILGETPALLGTTAMDTCRAVSFVQVLRLPRDLYLDFVTSGATRRDLVESREKLDFLRAHTLFADGVSCVTLSRLVRAAERARFSADQAIPVPANELIVLCSGEAMLTTPLGHSESLGAGSHVGATTISGFATEASHIRFLVESDAYRFALDAIANIPVVRWKLLETHRRRYSDSLLRWERWVSGSPWNVRK